MDTVVFSIALRLWPSTQGKRPRWERVAALCPWASTVPPPTPTPIRGAYRRDPHSRAVPCTAVVQRAASGPSPSLCPRAECAAAICAGRSLVAKLDSELDVKPVNWPCPVQWTARSFGSYLMAHLVATIEQLFFGNAAGPTLVPGVLSRPEDKLVYVALGSSSSFPPFFLLFFRPCSRASLWLPAFPRLLRGVPSVSDAEAAVLVSRVCCRRGRPAGLADLWFDCDVIVCPRTPPSHLRTFRYYAGHDLNIYFLRAMLGLKWTTESFNPNQSPPGGMLRFELLRDADKNPFVKLYFESQSYAQQRSASVLDPTPRMGMAPDRYALAWAWISACVWLQKRRSHA